MNFYTNFGTFFDLLFLYLVCRGKYFQWTTDRDVIICREVLVSEPYKFKARTSERGQSWESVVQHLNGIHQPSFRVPGMEQVLRPITSKKLPRQEGSRKSRRQCLGLLVSIAARDRFIEIKAIPSYID